MVALLLGGVGYDGRATAVKLNRHLTEEVPALVETQRTIDAVQDSLLRTMEALALAGCLQQTNPVARAWLECGTREARAGVRR